MTIRNINIRVSQELYDRVKAAANEDRRNLSNWVRMALEDRLDEIENDKRAGYGEVEDAE